MGARESAVAAVLCCDASLLWQASYTATLGWGVQVQPLFCFICGRNRAYLQSIWPSGSDGTDINGT